MAIVKNRIIAYKELARVHFMQGFQKHTPRPVLCYGLPLVINTISILLCWGYGSLKSGNNTINFPVSYTVQRTVVVSKLYSAATTSDTVDVFEKAPTALENFKIYSSYNGFDFYWIAIGY